MNLGYFKLGKHWYLTGYFSVIICDIWWIFEGYLKAKFDLPWRDTFQGESEGGGDWGDRGLLGSGRFTKSSLLDTPVPNPTSRSGFFWRWISWLFSTEPSRFASTTSASIPNPSKFSSSIASTTVSQNPSKFASNPSMLSSPSPIPNSCRLGVTKGSEGVLAKQVAINDDADADADDIFN